MHERVRKVKEPCVVFGSGWSHYSRWSYWQRRQWPRIPPSPCGLIATLGPILTDAQGRTLYKYTRDTENTSNCYDQCAVAWPPFNPSGTLTLPPDTGGRLIVIDRKDGTKMVAYDGMPLYYFVRDTKPGDTLGQNVNSVWFVVAPVPAAARPRMPRTGAGGLADGDSASTGVVAVLGGLLALRLVANRSARRRKQHGQ